MKTLPNSLSRPLSTVALGLVASALLPAITLGQTTGFNQAGAGPHDYNTSSNWVGNSINGIWDSALTLTAAQTVTLGANTTASAGLDFRYTGDQNVTLQSDGTGPYTLTLGGDINVATISTNRTITIGSTTSNQAINVDLGAGIRTFSVGGIPGSGPTPIRTLTLSNNLTNGGLILNGGGTVNLNGNTNTLTSLRIQNNALRLNGNGSSDVATTISGALTIDGAATSIASNTTQLGGIATLTLTPNGNHNTSLSASSLARANGGVVLFRGNNLGGTLGANGVSNITFTTAPTLIGGGGAAGSTNISILNWALGATTASGAANTFVTYDAVNGIRTLDTATEFQNYADTYGGAVTGTANSNTRIATGTVTFTGDNTVNSLMMGETGTSTLAGSGTLTVTSGAVYVNRNSSTISLNLNFGTKEGIIGAGQPAGVIISGGIAGSGGLTVYQSSPHTSEFTNGVSVTFTNAATFTGDFTVNSRAQVNHSDFLASGSRSGNTVVNGMLTLNGLGTDSRGYTMNGLYGNGRLAKGSSGAGLFIIGDNNSNGNFTGIITDGGNTVIRKIGTGTQIFSGANAYGGATQILGGTMEVTQLANGGLASGIGKTANTASNLVINNGTLKYTGATTSTDRLFQVGQTTTGGTATLNASGTGAVNFTNTGALTYGTAGSTGTAQTRSLFLTGTNTGDNTLSALIGNNGSAVNGNSAVSVTKSGAGTWVLSGANTYTGATTVNAGVLALGAADRISNSSNLVMAGGTFATRGFSETLGTLTLSASSIIDLGSGASALVFADSHSAIWTASVTLSFINFDAGTDSIKIGTTDDGLTDDQLAQIRINGHYALIDGSGFLSMGAAVPEPSSYAFLAGAAGLLFVTSRRFRNRRTS